MFRPLILLILLLYGRAGEAGFVAISTAYSQVVYSSGGMANYRIFPDTITVPQSDFKYFFNPLNFKDVDGSLLVGAADELYLLDKNLSVRDKYTWMIDSTSLANCQSSSDDPLVGCHNHIRVYSAFPSNGSLLLVCGTQGDIATQQCRTVSLSASSFGEETPAITPPSGFISPYSVLPGFGEFIERDSSDQRFFSGGFSLTDNTFFLSFFNVSLVGDSLQVVRDFSNDIGNRNWLNFPGTLVNYYRANYPPTGAINDYDYQFYFVFLRESLVDDVFIYSRVVRICRNDPGSDNGAHFTTYLKARIYCERKVPTSRQFPAAHDYQYNEISSFAFNDVGRYSENGGWFKLMYGTFTGPTIGPPGSALCVYRADNSIEDPVSAGFNRGVFDVYRVDVLVPAGGEAENVPFECSPSGRSDDDAQNVQSSQDISQIEQDPLLILDGLTVTQMVVDQVCVVSSAGGGTTCTNQDVLFLGTDMGKVVKVFFGTNGSDLTPVIAEEIILDDANSINQLSLQVEGSTSYLYVSTFSKIYKLPLQRCSRHLTCFECIGSRDPYCVWNTSNNTCEVSTLTAEDDGTGTVNINVKQTVHSDETPSFCLLDPTIEFASSAYTVSEDDASVDIVIRSTGFGEATSGLVELYTQNGSATEGSDYNLAVQEVNFDPGSNQTTVSISLIPDSIYEGSEFELFSVRLRLIGRGGANIGTNDVSMVTLMENDVVTVQFESMDLTIIEGGNFANISVVKTGESTVETTIQFSTVDMEALENMDYVSVQRTLTFEPSQSITSVVVPLISDDVLETVETFQCVLNLPLESRGTQLGTRKVTTITITDDDYVSVQFSDTEFSVTEGEDACAQLTINKTGNSINDVVFTVLLTPVVTGLAGVQDFDTTPVMLNISSSESQARICIAVFNDSVYESLETFSVELSSVNVLVLGEDGIAMTNVVSLSLQGRLIVRGNGIATVTILDNDAIVVEFESPSATVTEGSDSFYNLVIVKQGDSQLPLSLVISTLDEGGSTPVTDYCVISSQLIRINQSEQSVTHRLFLNDDKVVEGTEEVRVQIYLPPFDDQPRVSLGVQNVFNLLILDNDSVSVSFAETSVAVRESNGSLTVTILFTGYTDIPVDVYVTSTAGSANVGTDFEAVSQTVQFSSGQTQVLVRLTNDDIVESEESFSLHLTSNSSQVLIGQDVLSVTIEDDDSVQVSLTRSEVVLAEDIGMLEVTIMKIGSSAVDVSVQLDVASSTASASSDYLVDSGCGSLVLRPDVDSVVCHISIVNDTILEGTEEVRVQLSSNQPGVVVNGNTTLNVVIIDNDEVTFGWGSSNYLVMESDCFATLTIVITGQSDVPINILLSTTNIPNSSSNASPSQDYIPLNRTIVTYNSADATQQVLITLIDNDVVDGTRSLAVMLEIDENGSNVALDNSLRAYPPVRIRNNVTTVFINDDDTMATACPTDSPAGTTSIVDENTPTISSPVIPGGDLGSLGSSFYSSAVDSGVVLGCLLFINVVLLFIILLMTVLFWRKHRTGKMSKQEVIVNNYECIPESGMGLKNQFYREDSNISSLPPETPTQGREVFTTSTFDSNSKDNLHPIREESPNTTGQDTVQDGNVNSSSPLPEEKTDLLVHHVEASTAF